MPLPLEVVSEILKKANRITPLDIRRRLASAVAVAENLRGQRVTRQALAEVEKNQPIRELQAYYQGESVGRLHGEQESLRMRPSGRSLEYHSLYVDDDRPTKEIEDVVEEALGRYSPVVGSDEAKDLAAWYMRGYIRGYGRAAEGTESFGYRTEAMEAAKRFINKIREKENLYENFVGAFTPEGKEASRIVGKLVRVEGGTQKRGRFTTGVSLNYIKIPTRMHTSLGEAFQESGLPSLVDDIVNSSLSNEEKSRLIDQIVDDFSFIVDRKIGVAPRRRARTAGDAPKKDATSKYEDAPEKDDESKYEDALKKAAASKYGEVPKVKEATKSAVKFAATRLAGKFGIERDELLDILSENADKLLYRHLSSDVAEDIVRKYPGLEKWKAKISDILMDVGEKVWKTYHNVAGHALGYLSPEGISWTVVDKTVERISRGLNSKPHKIFEEEDIRQAITEKSKEGKTVRATQIARALQQRAKEAETEERRSTYERLLSGFLSRYDERVIDLASSSLSKRYDVPFDEARKSVEERLRVLGTKPSDSLLRRYTLTDLVEESLGVETMPPKLPEGIDEKDFYRNVYWAVGRRAVDEMAEKEGVIEQIAGLVRGRMLKPDVIPLSVSDRKAISDILIDSFASGYGDDIFDAVVPHISKHIRGLPRWVYNDLRTNRQGAFSTLFESVSTNLQEKILDAIRRA